MTRREDIPVVILCGGKGTRLRELTEVIPKPLVDVGGKPILWHILRHYAHHGFRRFVLPLGYKGEKIKEWFVESQWRTADVELSTRTGAIRPLEAVEPDDWTIKFVDTGADTNTGGRVKRIERHVDGERFLVTYGDGVSDVDLGRLLAFHEEKRRIGTLTAVNPFTSFGVVKFTRDHLVTTFDEKPRLDSWINGGYFVFERGIFDVLGADDVLEEEPLRTLTAKKELAIYRHTGFWKCVDTYKDWEALNALWAEGRRPWAVWENGR